jgi:DNA polymerase III alpha subunit
MRTTKIKNYRSLGVQNTLDLEVESKDHNFYAEDLVTSNSHSAAYAYLTAKTIWLKKNKPLHFFHSLLKMAQREQDSLGEVSIIEKELEFFGIKLLPPDLVKSQMDFTIEGKNIRYGLTDIKGIKEKSMEKLAYFKNEYSNKFEIFEAAKEVKLGLGVICPLIQAGALQGFSESRSRTVLEFQLWNILTAKEKVFCNEIAEENEFDLIKIFKALKKRVDSKGKPVIKETRVETIKKKYGPYLEIYLQNEKNEDVASWYYEQKLLGYSSKIRLFDLYKSRVPRLKPLEHIERTKDGTPCVFVGFVVKMEERISQNGNAYADFVISDEKKIFKVKIFKNGDRIEKCREKNGGELPKKDDIVIVEGTNKMGNTVFADTIMVQPVKIYMKLSQLK